MEYQATGVWTPASNLFQFLTRLTTWVISHLLESVDGVYMHSLSPHTYSLAPRAFDPWHVMYKVFVVHVNQKS